MYIGSNQANRQTKGGTNDKIQFGKERKGGGENGTSRGDREFSKLYIVCTLALTTSLQSLEVAYLLLGT